MPDQSVQAQSAMMCKTIPRQVSIMWAQEDCRYQLVGAHLAGLELVDVAAPVDDHAGFIAVDVLLELVRLGRPA